LVATVISGIVSTNLAPALERQNHTTSPSAQTPFVRAIIALGDVRPSHPIPNVRDDRRPSCGNETSEMKPLIWGEINCSGPRHISTTGKLRWGGMQELTGLILVKVLWRQAAR
jgi:hypothetical protein